MWFWISVALAIIALLVALSFTMMHTYERSRCEHRASVLEAEYDFHIIYGCTIKGH